MICLLNCQGERRKLRSPDPEIDAFMKTTAMEGQETSLVIDYVIKVNPLVTDYAKLRGLPVQRQINHILREVLDVERISTSKMVVAQSFSFAELDFSWGLFSNTSRWMSRHSLPESWKFLSQLFGLQLPL
ncbi:hypothetical protein Droror1_Dr00006469 [Drosera rotundifolia]